MGGSSPLFSIEQNPAGVQQIVVSNAPSLVFEGQVAGGSAAQTLVVDKSAFTFGLGVRF